MSRPNDFQPLSCLSLIQRQFIKNNVPEVKKKEHSTYVAVAKVANSTTAGVYINGGLGQGQMKGTIDEQGSSTWYQNTLVFIEQGSGSNLQFQTYTPMLESNLTMTSDGKHNVVFRNLGSGSNGITSIFQKDGDSYQWKTTDPNNPFLIFDTDTGNMMFTQEESSGSRFRFTEPLKTWEFPEQEAGRQRKINTLLSLDAETGNMEFTQEESNGSKFRFTKLPVVWEDEKSPEQEAGRQRKMCKVQLQLHFNIE